MATDQHSQRRPRESDDVDATTATDDATAEQVERDDIDALLDEIDEVLEENPEDFVRNYVQKGGQ